MGTGRKPGCRQLFDHGARVYSMPGQPEDGVVRHARFNCARSHSFTVPPSFDVLPKSALPVWLQVKFQLPWPYQRPAVIVNALPGRCRR
jgi:hypothetical protein